jgi:hypothetical protein
MIRLRTVLAIALIGACLTPVFAVPAAAANHPAISLSRTVGPVGAKVTVHGHGFAHRRPVSVRFRDRVRGIVQVASTTTTRSGTFSVAFAVPENPGGGHEVFAVDGAHRRSDPMTFTIRERVRMGSTQLAPFDRVCAQQDLQPKSAYTARFDLTGYPAKERIRVFLRPAEGSTVTAKWVITDRFGSAEGHYVQPNVPSGFYKVRTSSPSDRFPTSVQIFSTWFTCYAFSGTARPMRWRADGVGFLPGTSVRLSWSGSKDNPIFQTRVRADGTWGVASFRTKCAPHRGFYTVHTFGTDGQGRPVFVSNRNRLRTTCG